MKISDTSGQDITRAPKQKKNIWLVIGTGSLSLVILAWYIIPIIKNWTNVDISIPYNRVRVSTAEYGDFTRDISVQGRVIAANKPSMYNSSDGIIVYKVKAGDEVVTGQLLAEIDSPSLVNQYLQEDAALNSLIVENKKLEIKLKKKALSKHKESNLLKIELKTAKREKRRSDEAYKKQAISQFDYEMAKDKLKNIEVNYSHFTESSKLDEEELELELESLILLLDRQRLIVSDLKREKDALKLYSPINGIIANLDFGQKNKVEKNSKLLTIVDLSQFEVEIDIPESYSDDLSVGMAVEIEFNSIFFMASLISISPEVEDNQVKGLVVFTNEQPENLRESQRLTAKVLIEKLENVLTVQRGAFLESGNSRVAYVVVNGVAHRKSIKVGARSLREVEIIKGLKAGDKVIISGTESFLGAENVNLTQ